MMFFRDSKKVVVGVMWFLLYALVRFVVIHSLFIYGRDKQK